MAARRRRRSRYALVPPRPVIVVALLTAFGAVFVASRAGARSASDLVRYSPRDRSSTIGAGIVPSTLLIEPNDGDRALVRLIDHTQQTLFVECYILSDRQIIRALERASAQDVKVHVLLEPHPLGMGTQPQRVADELRAAGIGVRWTRPAFALTHAKFMVADDRVAAIASANFSHAGLHGNRDLVVIDREPADVRAASAVFRADWDTLSPGIFDANVVLSPDNARARLSRLLVGAHRYVLMYAEEIGDPRMEAALAALHRRGVAARLILAAGQTPAAAVWLARHGVAVRTLVSPYVHAKMILVDGQEAFVGSENLSTQSLDRNREVGVLVRGTKLRRLESIFHDDWKRAARLAP
jgi:phosphatidylserine/phosphatidylglycerophosphate/cardiolipin synthase-like enzyme